MKTKFSLILAFVVCVTMAFAKVEPSVAIVAGSANHIFKVVYKSETAKKVQVTIFNNANEIVFTESIKNRNTFTRPYNFSSLPEGEYTIEVKDTDGKKIEKVNYSLGTVKSIINITKMGNEKAKYMLTVANKGMNIIYVSILNADGETLLENAHIVDGDFGIVYNLVNNGTYTFIVSDKSGNAKRIDF